jgi:hypothetical protein
MLIHMALVSTYWTTFMRWPVVIQMSGILNTLAVKLFHSYFFHSPLCLHQRGVLSIESAKAFVHTATNNA